VQLQPICLKIKTISANLSEDQDHFQPTCLKIKTIWSFAKGADSGKCCKYVLPRRNAKKSRISRKTKNSQKVHSRGIAGDG